MRLLRVLREVAVGTCHTYTQLTTFAALDWSRVPHNAGSRSDTPLQSGREREDRGGEWKRWPTHRWYAVCVMSRKYIARIASHRLSPWSTLTVNHKTILYVVVPGITLSNVEVVMRLKYFSYIAKIRIRTLTESIVGLLRPTFCLLHIKEQFQECSGLQLS